MIENKYQCIGIYWAEAAVELRWMCRMLASALRQLCPKDKPPIPKKTFTYVILALVLSILDSLLCGAFVFVIQLLSSIFTIIYEKCAMKIISFNFFQICIQWYNFLIT
jgi:hypothetical protein